MVSGGLLLRLRRSLGTLWGSRSAPRGPKRHGKSSWESFGPGNKLLKKKNANLARTKW